MNDQDYAFRLWRVWSACAVGLIFLGFIVYFFAPWLERALGV